MSRILLLMATRTYRAKAFLDAARRLGVEVVVDSDPAAAAGRVPYPCVLKPVALAASRGVIRANNPGEFVDAFQRIAAMLEADRARQRWLLVESFIPGPEVALEGLLVAGALRV